jgi:glycine/D-amino acid oxidase-like deaminating enzyme
LYVATSLTSIPGPFLGSLPPNQDRQMKWWGSKIFSHTQQVLPGRFVSAPPRTRDYSQWKVSRKLQEDIKHVSEVFYGSKGKHWTYEKHRICWDAFTTTGDFIVSPHSAAKGLYVATCGSFHGWKFFPVIGKYVVQMLEGSLEPALVQKWAWDRERPDSSNNPEYPRVEMRELEDDRPRL